MTKITGFANSTFYAERAEEFLLDGPYGDPSVNDIVTVVPKINTQKQVVYVDRFDKVLLADGGCGRIVGNTKAIEDREKLWTPKAMEAWISICGSDFDAKVINYQRALGLASIEAPQLTALVLDLLNDAIAKDLLRQAWFNDVQAEVYTSAGKLATADDKVHYNVYDGLFDQISAAITATTIKNIPISENALSTTALQTALAANKAYDTLMKMFKVADSRLRNDPNSLILMTNELFFNFMETLIARDVESSKVEIQNGFSMLKFYNHTIVNMDIWSRYIASDFRADASSLYNPNRIVWAPKSELMLGVDVLPTNTIKTWVNYETEYVHAKAKFVADAKIGREYLICTAGCE